MSLVAGHLLVPNKEGTGQAFALVGALIETECQLCSKKGYPS